MKPYYDDGQCVIYHADCREVLWSLEPADLLLTDPPYGVNWISGKGNHDRIAGDDGSLTPGDWLGKALRTIRRGRHAYIFGLRAGDVPDEAPIGGTAELIWDKQIIGMGDLNSPWGPTHEVILFGVQEISKANRAKGYGVGAARIRKGSVLRVQRGQSGQTRRHPTEKPVELLRILIESSSTFGETVLDPFMGVGSTLVAAALEGRKAVGIEIDERYCEMAAKRLAEIGSTPDEVVALRQRLAQSEWIDCAEALRILDGQAETEGQTQGELDFGGAA